MAPLTRHVRKKFLLRKSESVVQDLLGRSAGHLRHAFDPSTRFFRNGQLHHSPQVSALKLSRLSYAAYPTCCVSSGFAAGRPTTILSSNCPISPSASTWSSCFPAEKLSSSARKAAYHGARSGTYNPLSAMRPRIDCARRALSPRVGNCSRYT